jgi:hypothetical protein
MSRLRHWQGWAVLVAALAAAWASAGAPRPAEGTRRLEVVVQETAGIRRFGYPVSAVLTLAEPVQSTDSFRLLEQGKLVPAQFRPHGDTSRGVRQVSLDFNVSHAPLETRTYTVEYGGQPPSPPRGGLEVHAEDGPGGRQFRVAHSPSFQFVVPADLLGLLRGVRADKGDYLRPGSAGLVIRYKDHIHYRVGGFGPDGVPTRARVVKSGPLAAALRFEGTEALRGERSVASVVDMEFPRSKSWVKVAWTVEDQSGLVAGLGADLNLNVQGEPTLVDFGAGSGVYAHLRKGQRAVLRAGSLDARPAPSTPAWQTLLGPAESLAPFVVAPPGQGPPAEGWAHVMDRQRCTAVAVAGFADRGQEADITVDADGRLRLWKHFARDGAPVPAGPKTLVFWLHFVSMPVQVGALTSPQAMLAPLRVQVRRP